MKNDLVIYQTKSGAIELKGDFKKETIWANQAHLAKLFRVERSVITKHIRNILRDGELRKESVCANFAHTAKDGKTYQVQYYNLDVILAVGYRTNSVKAVQFRQWATKILREYIVDGYAINKKLIAKNYQRFQETLFDLRKILPEPDHFNSENVIELVSAFASTWLSLEAYDTDTLLTRGTNKKSVTLTVEQLMKALGHFKQTIATANNFFGQERQLGNIAGIVGNVMQSFDRKPLYPTLEEKAAHLLYFMVKDHPLVDGNKRSGAFAFVWFLRKYGLLNPLKITPETLTALTLLVAESKPDDKDRMIGVILSMLRR